MSKEFITNILCLVFGIIGMVLIGYYSNLMVLLGIFLFIWSNNINISQYFERANKKEMSYLKQLVDKLFGENLAELEKMSQNMKVSEK